MPKLREYDKTKLEQAIQDVLSKKESYRSAELKYGIPKSTIEFKIKNPEHKSTCGPSPVLTEDEEQILVRWVKETARKGFPRKANDLKSSVQKFLNDNPRQNPFNNNRPGDGWLKAFLKRHPEISERTSESVSAASACISEKDLRQWFFELNNYIKEKALEEVLADPSRVFNGDETGFQINPATGKVFAQRGSKNVYTIDRGSSKENITVMFTFSASGYICVPMIVYPYMRFPEKVSKSVNSEWGIGRSVNGWMTSETFYEYIANVFHPHLVKNNTTFPIILFLDGHKSHLNYSLSILCSELQIEIFSLYPNATRILQPCDVAVFRPLKDAWRRTVREWEEDHPGEVINKVNFAPVLEKAIKSSIKPETLVNGFRACGLYPLNPDAIDYSKCLGANGAKNKNIDANNLLPNSVMHYTTFVKIVGQQKISQFEILDQHIPDFANDDFQSLFTIWQHFKNTTQNEINIENQDIITDKEETIIQNQNILRDQDEINYASPKKSPLPPLPMAPPQNNTLSVDVLVHVPKSSYNQILENNELPSTSSGIQENKRIISTKVLSENILTKSNKFRQIDSPLFGQYLTIPESPKRKGKRNIERIPFAITSKKCQDMFEKKRQLKEMEERKKEERKRKREEKLRSKKETIKEKSVVKKNRQDNKKCCECNKTVARNDEIQCETCKGFYHEHCIPKKHKKFIVDTEDPDEIFLCHICYKEDTDTDVSTDLEKYLRVEENDSDVDELFEMYKDHQKNN